MADRDNLARDLEAPARALLAAITAGAVLRDDPNELWTLVDALGDQIAKLDAWDQAQADKRAWSIEEVDVEGGRLIVGGWYDVATKAHRWGREHVVRRWRNCRYIGRYTLYGGTAYRFERYGANAGADPYPRGKIDAVGEAALVSVASITIDPRLTDRLAERARERAENEARAEVLRAERDAARAERDAAPKES